MGSEASFELEIQQLLATQIEPGQVVQTLLTEAADLEASATSSTEMSLPEVRGLCLFLLTAGELPRLIQFLSSRLLNKKRIPWDLFVEALFQACAAIPEDFKKALIRGAKSQDAYAELIRVRHLDYFDEQIPEMRAQRAIEAQERAERIRAELLSELELMKNQKIESPQLAQLKKMDRLFPEDSEIKNLLHSHQEKREIESLSPKRNSSRPLVRPEPPDPEIEKAIKAIDLSMTEYLQKNPELAFDFSISHLMWENHRSALRFLEMSPESAARGWLRAHLLLSARRFVDLLDLLPQLESRDLQNPEAPFEAIYLRAQAHWGLGDKFKALELMESLLEQRPSYRAGSSLLAEWKENLS